MKSLALAIIATGLLAGASAATAAAVADTCHDMDDRIDPWSARLDRPA